jgi:hypothetical protein
MNKFTQSDINRQNSKVAASNMAINALEGSVARPDIKKVSGQPKRSKNGYNVDIVLAYFKEYGLPEPEREYQFAAIIGRRWRFDFAWPHYQKPTKVEGFDSYDVVRCKIALEIDGGIWINGGHNRGAQMLKTWEKENEAACMGWRIIRCQPKDLCTQNTVNLIKRALGINSH